MRRGLLGDLHKPGTCSRPGLVASLAGTLALALAAAGCGLATPNNSGHTPTSGGTATYALPAEQHP